MLNLNMTGGSPVELVWQKAPAGNEIIVTQNIGPNFTAKFDMVDAWSWEGGRGARCALWAEIGAEVPE